jgi:5-methylcytosine-specific restriction endonuclease McrA
MKVIRRRTLSPVVRKQIRAKTGGRCHVCGGPLGSEWMVDHVRPRARGGQDAEWNLLPACDVCNATRWNRSSKVIRRMLQLGMYFLPEIRSNTNLGKAVLAHYKARRLKNDARRKR